MGECDVRGPGARAFLDFLVTNDVGRLYPGRVLYSPMCQPDGGVVDDLLVAMRGEGDYLLCLNAGNTAKDLAWIREQAAAWPVTIEDRSDETALLAVQGPAAAAIVGGLADAPLDGIRNYHFTRCRIAGVPCIASRTGYTGEDGFELYHAPAFAGALAEAILKAGAPRGLQLCGLGARDSLRLEAGYPLYGHELDRDLSPIAAGLAWTVKFGKGCDFNGRQALLAERDAGRPRRVVHFRTGDRRIARAGTPVLGPGGAPAGRVLSGTLSPILNEAIGSALVGAEAAAGPLSVSVRGDVIPLRIVTPPFAGRAKPA
jgi:aminomethyltransferase